MRQHKTGVDIVDEAPWWVGGAIAASMVALAVISVLEASDAGAHQLEVALTLAVAISPWLLDLVPPWSMPPATRAATTIGALGLLNLGGVRWGWIDLRVESQLSFMIVVWLIGEMAAIASGRVIAGTWAGALGLVVGRSVSDEYFDAANPWVGGMVLAFGCGLLVRLLLRAVADLKAAQAQLEIEAVRGERQRIAREIHDVVAHSLTVSMLHVTAARMAIDRGDEAAAVDALEEAERAGRTSLRDIRRTVGLLRDDTPSATAPPEPDATDLPALVESWAAAGMDVELRVDGRLDGIGATAGLVLYRVAQESLVNAARHLPGATTVLTLTVAAGSADLVVDSSGSRPGPRGEGHGITGMYERVASLGGAIEVGPTANGWRVATSVPLAEPASTVGVT